MEYDQIEVPTTVPAGKLAIREAIGAISRLPLAAPEDPGKLLRQKMADGSIPALLVDADTGQEYPIQPSVWQGRLADAAFHTMIVDLPVKGSISRRGWIVLQISLVRRAIAPLIERPDLPPEAVAILADPKYRHNVELGISDAKATAFDAGVKQWRASKGTDAQKVAVTFSAKIEGPRDRIARQAEQQERTISLSSLPSAAPDWGTPDTTPPEGKTIEGQAVRVERGQGVAAAVVAAEGVNGRKQPRTAYMRYVSRWFDETGAPGSTDKERRAKFEDWLEPLDPDAHKSIVKLLRSTRLADEIKRLRRERR